MILFNYLCLACKHLFKSLHLILFMKKSFFKGISLLILFSMVFQACESESDVNTKNVSTNTTLTSRKETDLTKYNELLDLAKNNGIRVPLLQKL